MHLRSLSSSTPPEAQTKAEMNPTLLFSWWCTGFSVAIIFTRLVGRLVRNDKLFREDKLMALSLIPLMIRMGFIHVVLIYGTNNAINPGWSEQDIYRRAIGSRLVLAARIFYAAFIWMAKLTVSEFLKRLTSSFWNRRSEFVLQCIRVFLLATFVGVVIATLAECQPFDHYWQVVPDPGPRCRTGYAQLLTMGVADMITDVLLVVFPIPIIIKSAMPMKRKFSLLLLFSLSVGLIVITAFRIPNVIHRHGRQQYRTVWASAEILGATAVSNAIIIGSFLRDRGVKKSKYRFGSTTDSMERTASRRPTIRQWGSDEDLMRDICYRLDPELHAQSQSTPRAPPQALPAVQTIHGRGDSVGSQWNFPKSFDETRDSEESISDIKCPPSEDPMPSPREVRSPSVSSPKRSVSFFDIGGLLEDEPMRSPRSSMLAPSPTSTTSAQDFASSRRGSRALLADLGGLLLLSRSTRQGTVPEEEEESHEMGSTASSQTLTTNGNGNGQPLIGVPSPAITRQETMQSLQDIGGLLSPSDPGEASQSSRPPRA
ncbi:hypothetical protein K402DRAFT_342632 [Aulographum hederae CBS 113979]|uniref:Rhodopsin domain-containing protein n=1 Tax=Aulographum hederae CBS 113979 TaxID=1176131 RepID=A0A6G1GKB2_9PEZI|nr:hypothetical protein K402DRAFT_342632 [Aulographum hederae CBS 113979]